MKIAIPALAIVAGLAGCTAIPEIEPIPGSITYGGRPTASLAKAPPGSTLRHMLKDEYGRPAEETYIIQPDRSLRLVRRERLADPR